MLTKSTAPDFNVTVSRIKDVLQFSTVFAQYYDNFCATLLNEIIEELYLMDMNLEGVLVLY